jgi:DNA-binding response OmpR family regulator
MKKPPGIETALKVLLSISPGDEDCVFLERIFKSEWTVIGSATLAAALAVLREMPVPIVMVDCNPTSGAWKEVLDCISFLPDPPLLILTSRLADERLWAEALNLGAWDVLAKPFQSEEAIRAAACAWRHWQDRHGVHSRITQQRKAVTGNSRLAATGT